MNRWMGWGPGKAVGRWDAWRLRVAVAAVAAVTAGLAVLAAVLTHEAWAPVAVTVLGGVPGLVLAYLAVPGVISQPGPADAGKTARGRLVTQWNPLDLGMHKVIGGGPLTAYVTRPHDELLRAVMDPSVTASRLVVLSGGSSTGKTRAAWEAVASRLPDWQLDYPHNPAALRERLDAGVAPGTVLWLGELRQYADADGGEEVLGRLAGLLDGEGILIVTTAWPEQLAAYAAAAPPEAARAPAYEAAGRLLKPLHSLAGREPAAVDPGAGGLIEVPGKFTGDDLESLAASGDQTLAEAAARAAAAGDPGQVTQYLAGVPDLLNRYSGPADKPYGPYGQAVITAAMDAARLGHASLLPGALLQEAAVGYLNDDQRTWAIAEWRDGALDWASQELKGAVRALRPVPPGEGTGVAGYRLADYLDQHGRSAREGKLGPASLWDALAARTASVTDLRRIAWSAQSRGLYRYAAALWTAAVAQGSALAAADLIQLLHTAAAGGTDQAADWAVSRAGLDDPDEVAGLLRALREAGASDAATALGHRAAAHATLDDRGFVATGLLRALREAGASDAATALGHRAAAHATLDDLLQVLGLLTVLREVGASDVVTALGRRAAAHAALDEPDRVQLLLLTLHKSGDSDAVTTLLARDPAAQAALDQPGGVAFLLGALREVGASDAVTALGRRAAAHAALDEPGGVGLLLGALHKSGDSDAVTTLLARDPAARVSLGNLYGVGLLLGALREAGASDAVTALGRRAAAHAALDHAYEVAGLLGALREAGASDAVTALGRRAAAHAALDDPDGVAELLEALHKVGASDAVTALLARDPAAHASLDSRSLRGVAGLLEALHKVGASDAVAALGRRAAAHAVLDQPYDSYDIAGLLTMLHKVGASDAVTTLARRAAAHAALYYPDGVARLLEALHEVGASDAVTTLLARDPAAHASLGLPGGVTGLLEALREAGASDAVTALARRAGDAGDYVGSQIDRPYGREPDGAPSQPWSWKPDNGPLSGTSARHGLGRAAVLIRPGPRDSRTLSGTSPAARRRRHGRRRVSA
jgi:hypothetical protein